MRKFQKAALAGATAVAVAFGSTSVALAEETTTETTQDQNTQNEATKTGVPTRKPTDKDKAGGEITSSNKLAHSSGAVDKDGNLTGAKGTDIFGKDKKWENLAPWAKAGYLTTIFLSVSAAIGLIVGPLYNFIVHGPVKF